MPTPGAAKFGAADQMKAIRAVPWCLASDIETKNSKSKLARVFLFSGKIAIYAVGRS